MITMPSLWRRVLARVRELFGVCKSCGGKRKVTTCHLDDPEGHGGLMPCPECVDSSWVEDWNRRKA